MEFYVLGVCIMVFIASWNRVHGYQVDESYICSEERIFPILVWACMWVACVLNSEHEESAYIFGGVAVWTLWKHVFNIASVWKNEMFEAIWKLNLGCLEQYCFPEMYSLYAWTFKFFHFAGSENGNFSFEFWKLINCSLGLREYNLGTISNQAALDFWYKNLWEAVEIR